MKFRNSILLSVQHTNCYTDENGAGERLTVVDSSPSLFVLIYLCLNIALARGIYFCAIEQTLQKSRAC